MYKNLKPQETWPLPVFIFLHFYSLKWPGSTAVLCSTPQRVCEQYQYFNEMCMGLKLWTHTHMYVNRSRCYILCMFT